jgi:hypothetical protein
MSVCVCLMSVCVACDVRIGGRYLCVYSFPFLCHSSRVRLLRNRERLQKRAVQEAGLGRLGPMQQAGFDTMIRRPVARAVPGVLATEVMIAEAEAAAEQEEQAELLAAGGGDGGGVSVAVGDDGGDAGDQYRATTYEDDADADVGGSADVDEILNDFAGGGGGGGGGGAGLHQPQQLPHVFEKRLPHVAGGKKRQGQARRHGLERAREPLLPNLFSAVPAEPVQPRGGGGAGGGGGQRRGDARRARGGRGGRTDHHDSGEHGEDSAASGPAAAAAAAAKEEEEDDGGLQEEMEALQRARLSRQVHEERMANRLPGTHRKWPLSMMMMMGLTPTSRQTGSTGIALVAVAVLCSDIQCSCLCQQLSVAVRPFM